LSNKIEDLKKIYDDIEIPENIEDVIKKSVIKANTEGKKEKNKKIFKGGIGIAAAIILAFTVSINTIPAFASTVANVPGLGKLVSILQFKDGAASGGRITDGANVDFISLKKENDKEHVIINFSKIEAVPHFNVEYKEYPYSMTFIISGAREIAAEKYFDNLKESNLIKDVYKLITLDDSMVRFTVVFNKPVKYELKEYKNPAQAVLTLDEDREKTNTTVYAVRTSSYQYGEEIGMAEEVLFDIEGKRILKDQKGTFCVEVGYYSTEEEANLKAKELGEKYSMQFYVEKRETVELPKYIK